MTAEEAFNKITSEHKWYVGYCTKPYASILKKRFWKGTLKPSTLIPLFEHFGYSVNFTAYDKKSENKFG